MTLLHCVVRGLIQGNLSILKVIFHFFFVGFPFFIKCVSTDILLFLIVDCILGKPLFTSFFSKVFDG